MGCSASRSQTVSGRPTEEPPPPPASSFANPPSSSSSLSSSWHCLSPTPISRTLSLPTPLVHHPALRKGNTNHLVSLTSTTYGSLLLVDPIPNPNYSNKTPAEQKEPSSPDSVINTWELMEGLDDFDFVEKPIVSSIRHSPMESPKMPNFNQSVDFIGSVKKGENSSESMGSFNSVERPISSVHDCRMESPRTPNSYPSVDGFVSVKTGETLFELLSSFEIVESNSDSKPLWKHLSEESLLAKMDPNVGWSYRRALTSKQLGFREKSPEPIRPAVTASNQLYLPGTEDRIVLYYTSLRGIRRTYEDCCAVRMIFRGFSVHVDERDISMDSEYRKELQSVLGGKAVCLPRVFIGGKYVGGADEIKQLHECGELVNLLEGFPVQDLGYVCESCGDARFMPCSNCNGSRKVFEEEEGKLRRCPVCNENGLIRCPSCCS